MSEHFIKTIDALREKLADQERAANKTKSMINDLCELAGLPIEFPSLDDPSSASTNSRSRSIDSQIRSDDYYGTPLSTAIRRVLELRKSAGDGPTEVKEIHRLLSLGGYDFNTKDVANAITGLWVSISKNSTTFVKLPNGSVGLAEWYDKPKTRLRIKNREIPDADAMLNELSGEQTEDSNGDEQEKS